VNGAARAPAFRRTAASLLALNVTAWIGLWALGGIGGAVFGIGVLAYGFGLRHAFDADHIAAIDNVTRLLRAGGARPAGVGFFFALGHSTVVLLLSLGVVLAVGELRGQLPALQRWGGWFGTLVSAGFLTAVGGANLVIFTRLWRAFRHQRRWGRPHPELPDAELEALLQRRGLWARALRALYRRVDRSWKMYPLGFLFGLGFDTATEIAILGISALAAQSGALPLWGVMVFPLLFTAAMTLMDTLDGWLMLRAYDWALSDAGRKLSFNTAVTGCSVLLALAIGGIEWTQLLAPRFGTGAASVGVWDPAVVGAGATALILGAWLWVWTRHRRTPGAPG